MIGCTVSYHIKPRQGLVDGFTLTFCEVEWSVHRYDIGLLLELAELARKIPQDDAKT